MKIVSSDYLITAAAQEGYPTEGYPEIVFFRTSNVGKSTFINKLLNRKNLARTSATPGKTRALNFYIVNEMYFFVDVPGYGYARVSQKERELFGAMIEEYLTNRPTLKFAVLLVDFKVGPTEDDILMYKFLKHFDLKTVILCTKKDKIKKSAHAKQKKMIIDKLEKDPKDKMYIYSASENSDINMIRENFGIMIEE